jgi:glucokinase-like ROK family protein
MMFRINDQKALRINNQLNIMRTLRNESPMSRNLIQIKTGLSWGSISSLVNELMLLDIIREAGAVSTGVGRRPVYLDLNTSTNYAIGLWLSGDRVDAIILDIKGGPIQEFYVPLDPCAPAEDIVERLFNAVDGLISRASLSPELIAGIGIAVPGVYNPATGVCVYAPNHPRWSNVPLRTRFEERYRIPVFIDHDLNCCVLGEHWFGAGKGLNTFLCVSIDGGIGAGIIIDGRTYRGVDNTAGELGHIQVNPDGPRCNCGRDGCLEVYASGRMLLNWLHEHLPSHESCLVRGNAESDNLHLGLNALIQAAGSGNEDVIQLFNSMGRYLGVGIATLIALFNPETVILGGSVCRAKEYFLPNMNKTLEETAWSYSRVDIRFSTLQKAITVGAAGMVLSEVFNNALLFR